MPWQTGNNNGTTGRKSPPTQIQTIPPLPSLHPTGLDVTILSGTVTGCKN